MGRLQDAEQALIRADQAGDAEAAKALAAEVRRLRAQPVARLRAQPVAIPIELRQPITEYVSLWDRTKNVGAGIRAAITAPLVGLNQRLGRDNAQHVADAWQEDMDAISKRPGGMGGQVLGSAMIMAPVAALPIANTVLGGGAVGALSGALTPTQEGESVAGNVLAGTIAGSAVPLAVRSGKAIRAMAFDPFTEAGRTRIAGGVLNRMARDDAQAVQGRLANAQGNTPGFIQSVAQAARNDGISAFERTMRTIEPGYFNALDKQQRGALVDALLSIAKTPEERAAAVALRESAVKPLYDAAKLAQVPGDQSIDLLLQRPIIKQAQDKAREIAANEGRSFLLANGTQSQAKIVTDPVFGTRTVTTPKTPAVFSGQSLHDLKMGIDAAMLGPENQGLAAAQKAAQGQAKSDYLAWLESKIPEYRQARTAYANMSRPIGQMDIGTELYNRFVPALAGQENLPFKTTAESYARALLRNGDDLARNATGLKNATLAGTMEPDQLALLRGIAKDAEAKAAAEAGGRGVGSDTVQKIAMSNIASEAGIPTWLSNIARVPGGWAKRAGDILYGNADEQVRKNLAFLLTNPQEAAAAMQAAGANPSKLGQFLKRSTQGAALSSPGAYSVLTAE